MRRNSREQYGDVRPATSDERDSPTIQNLIEQLDRDLEETEYKASKAR
jgi:hypothetical protein